MPEDFKPNVDCMDASLTPHAKALGLSMRSLSALRREEVKTLQVVQKNRLVVSLMVVVYRWSRQDFAAHKEGHFLAHLPERGLDRSPRTPSDPELKALDDPLHEGAESPVEDQGVLLQDPRALV